MSFGLKKSPWAGSVLESRRQTIVDVWNTGSTLGVDQGRIMIGGLFDPALAGGPINSFDVYFYSGSDGWATPTSIGQNLDITGSSWHHYGFSFTNQAGQLEGKLYVDGKLNDTVLAHTSITGPITGAMAGRLGSLISELPLGVGGGGAVNRGKLSGSLDEFRFWKSSRNGREIGQNWFRQINGGTNTDFTHRQRGGAKYSFTNPVDLGVYYKFNEGIINPIQVDITDRTVLDYSGRITNGAWEGYSVGSRNTGSAIVDAKAAESEFKVPILYSFHPLVAAKAQELYLKGFNYDLNNNASIYQSLPGWIRDEDAVNERNVLLKLTQILSSYFDSLQLQIQQLPRLKDIDYISGSYYKPLPFSNRLVDGAGLTSTELFADATALEALASRDDFREFAEKIDQIKNKIYKNIYNNLVYIFKSKGTEKSIRNLIRCYGIGTELVKLNLYADQTTFDLKENFESLVTRKRYANFYATASFDASVYQSASLTNLNQRPFISSSANEIYNGNTFEVEMLFVKKETPDQIAFIYTPFSASSLFGLHTYDESTPEDPAWAASDVANFQVRAIRTDLFSKDAYFELSSSTGGIIPTLTSSIQLDVYDDSKWNIAVRIKPQSYPLGGFVSGTSSPDYSVEFLGYSTILDRVVNQFLVTSSVSFAEGSSFLTSSKRAYIGAHRTNFTGSVLESSDAKISSVRYWLDYLEDRVILAHAKDPSNFGRLHPGRNTFLNQQGFTFGQQVTEVPQIETLALQWNFDTVSGSDAAGEFIVEDYSSGSLEDTLKYGWIGPLARLRHPGQGINFPANNVDATMREYVYTAKQQPPETINSSDMVEIKNEGDIEIFHRDTRPIRFFFALEKSMYAIISAEMIKLFATVLDFNNLIGEPVNRYRQDYKALEKIRQIFFERIENPTVDFEKFVEYYKWIDESILKVASQLFPVTANFSRKVFAVLESHVLERNKYWNKFPTLEMKFNDPEAGLYGINEMLYPYKRGSAPIPLSQSVHCVWANARAEREVFSSGDPIIDEQRNTFRDADDFYPSANSPVLTDIAGVSPIQYQGSTYALRNFTKIYRFAAEEMPTLHGGSNVARIKNVQYAHAELPFGSTTQLKVIASEIESDINCDDVVDPSAKVKLRYKLTNNPTSYKSGKGDIFAPWSLYSSSVESGYAAQISASFRSNTDITNYHDDFYGDDKETPMQGPFPEKYVGGREYRHVPFWTADALRTEAWNLGFTGTVSAAEPEKSMYFQDGGEHVLIPSSSALPLGIGEDFSVSFWVNPSSATANRKIMISRQDDSTFAGGWHISQGPSYGGPTYQFQFFVGSTSGGGAITSGLSTSTWHHIVATYNQSANELYLYRNTVQSSVGTRNPHAVEDGSTGSVTIGATLDANNDFDGYINNVALFNKVLSTGEVSTIYNSGCPADLRGFSGITNWWRLGDGDTYPTAQDTIGSDDGTMTNMSPGDIVEEAACATTVEPAITTTSNKALKLTSRTIHQPRSTILREPLAKRPVNIRNIRQTTGSTIIGNYTHDYEIVQTSDRRINNRFFVKNGGFSPTIATSSFIPDVVDYELPDFSKYGKTKWIFVERFNAPGGPEVSSRGAMDIDSEQYAVYNDLNLRNSLVRNALKKWQTSYNGQFGIDSSRQVAVNGSPFGVIIGPGEPEGFRQPRTGSYNTLASYHKTPRNAASRGLCKSSYSREVEWVELVGTFLDNFNRTISSSVGAGGFVTHYAESNQIVETTGYFEIVVGEVAQAWAMGISSDNHKANNTTPTMWDFSFYDAGGGIVKLYERDVNVTPAPGFFNVAVGDRLRIFRDKSTIEYQYLAVGTLSWITLFTSPTTPNGNYYPRVAFAGAAPNEFLLHGRISNPRYDNWFVQHPIPQDELQYSWINASYDHTKDQPFGLLGSPDGGRTNFTIPVGNPTSIPMPQPQLLYDWSASVAIQPGFSCTDTIPFSQDFVGLNTLIYDPIIPDENLLSSSNGDYENTEIAVMCPRVNPAVDALHALLLHRNGPYQYPSWKQIRTGERPVARHQKKNNIITVGERSRTVVARLKLEKIKTLLGSSAVRESWYRDNTKTTRYKEPMVTFKYFPLQTNLINTALATTAFRFQETGPVSFRHSFCNNLYYFANEQLTEDFGLRTYSRDNPEYHDSRGPTEPQMHELFLAQYQNDPSIFSSLNYSEVIYPKEIFTGLAQTRGRVQYAEDAPLDSSGFAVADYGSNGIDRNSSERRTFWSDTW